MFVNGHAKVRHRCRHNHHNHDHSLIFVIFFFAQSDVGKVFFFANFRRGLNFPTKDIIETLYSLYIIYIKDKFFIIFACSITKINARDPSLTCTCIKNLNIFMHTWMHIQHIIRVQDFSAPAGPINAFHFQAWGLLSLLTHLNRRRWQYNGTYLTCTPPKVYIVTHASYT